MAAMNMGEFVDKLRYIATILLLRSALRTNTYKAQIILLGVNNL
jgi:hypothetical protein